MNRKMLMSEPRDRAIESLSQTPLDLLVIGGGIVGAGVARDAAMRGLRAGLIEQHDFAFGTSSRTSRLLHGGLRYLAQGRLGLVRQASVEKRTVHQIAPHLCDPLVFVFPTYRGTSWKRWKLHIGVKLYDLLCGGRNFGRSHSMSRESVLRHVPGLRAGQLTGAVRYYDGLTNDARLVVDTLRSAAKAGAVISNYVRFIDAQPAQGGWECALIDQLTGAHCRAEARCIVNATGPWADGLPHSSVKLRLTKGVHLVINRARLPVPEAIVMTEDQRILFVIPWGKRVLVGTTDTDYRERIEEVRSGPEDVRYLLQLANQYFPAANLRESDVISTWAGLRPLLADPSGRPSEISRSHQIRSPQPGWWDVTGGKLTTYRLMAEQAVDQIVTWLKDSGCLEGEPRPCRTAVEPLLPETETNDGFSGTLPPPFDRRVVEHCCTAEWAVHLDDVMVRRTSWHYYHADAIVKAEQVAAWMREIFGWAPVQFSEEISRYLNLFELGKP